MGARRDPRRFRADAPHDPSRRDGHAAADRHRRRATPHGVGDAQLRGLQRRRGSGEVCGTAGAGAASVAGEEAVSAGRRRLRRIRGLRRAGRARRGGRPRPRGGPPRGGGAPGAGGAAAGGGAGPGSPGGAPGSPGGAPGSPAGAPGSDAPPPPAADPNAKYATIDTSGYDPLIGCTIGEVGGVAASMHKCQGRSPIQNFGGAGGARYKLAATVIESQQNKDETSLFEGIDTSLASLLQYGGTTLPAA